MACGETCFRLQMLACLCTKGAFIVLGLPCRRIDTSRNAQKREAIAYFGIESAIALFIALLINICVVAVFAKCAVITYSMSRLHEHDAPDLHDA